MLVFVVLTLTSEGLQLPDWRGPSRRAHEPRTATAAAGAAEDVTLLQRSYRGENGGAKSLGKV